MKKRVFAVLLAFCLTLAFLPGTVAATTVVASGECGKQGGNLTWMLDDMGTLTISGTGEMQDYEQAEECPWDTHRESITNVVLDNGVTSIGDGAFTISGLESIVFPDSLTSIGNDAFYYCQGLTSITLPDNLTSIGVNAFSNCWYLESITLPNSLTSLGNRAFHFSGLTSIKFPDGLTSIGEGTCSLCYFLKNITFPDSLTNIDEGAFECCYALTSITLSSKVENIGLGVFTACDELSDVQYSGTKSQWKQISIDKWNESLDSATIHCSDGDILPNSDNTPETVSKLTDGVKFVPYYAKVDNYEIASDASVCYELEGTLPSGLSLDPKTAAVSGVPMADGTWNFTVKRTLSNTKASDSAVELPCSLTILNNTDSAVQQPNDYEIIIPVGTPDRNDPNHFYKTEYTEETLKIDGPYDEFYRLLIDGTQLREPDDYTAKEGSTVITIQAQTFQRFGEGTHTIAAEFRPSNNPSQVKRVAQNYTLNLSKPSTGGTSSSGNGSGSSKPSIRPGSQQPPAQKPGNQQTALPFGDVNESDWYYEDVFWAYNEGVMQGIDGNHFGPNDKVSQATIVTVLARLAKIDLSKFEGETEADVPEGQYFTAAAIWAKRAGLMPSGGAFTGSEVTTRNQMAVMLTKYLTSMGKDTTPPAQPVAFADAPEMSQEGNNAFQTLYQYGIFRGTGEMKMEPAGSTTRAQFAALMHRVYDTAVG